MQNKFKQKLLLIFLVSNLLFIIFIFIMFDFLYDTRRSEILSQNLQSAQISSDFIDDQLTNTLQIATLVANDPILTRNLETNKDTALEYLENVAKELKDIGSIAIVDREGDFVLNVPPQSDDMAVNIADRPHFQEVLRTKKPALSPLVIDRLTGQYTISALSPILKNDEIEYMVRVNYDLVSLKEKLEKMLAKAENGKMIIVFEDNGDLVLISNQALPAEKKQYSDRSFILQTRTKDKVFIENERIEEIGTPLIGTTQKVKKINWVVVSAQATSEVYNPIRNLQIASLLIIVTSLVFSLATSTYLIRKVRIIY